MSTYLQKHKASGLKIGDRVKVIRKAKNHEQGWRSFWSDEMDGFIGKECVIMRDKNAQGFALHNPANPRPFYFPYFVLEAVTPSDNALLINRIAELEDELAAKEEIINQIKIYINKLENNK